MARELKYTKHRIAAHIDAGKTTTERILFYTGKSHKIEVKYTNGCCNDGLDNKKSKKELFPNCIGSYTCEMEFPNKT
jgi:translation elongation factor EF-G